MINNKYLRDAIVTAIIFMIIKLVIGNDYSQTSFLKVAWQGFLFVPFYYVLTYLLNKNKAKK
jgi:accessory gene regulator protein AgrB